MVWPRTRLRCLSVPSMCLGVVVRRLGLSAQFCRIAVGQRHFHDESTALTSVSPDGAGVRVHDGANKGETQSRAGGRRDTPAASVEWFEQAGHVMRRDLCAVVLNAQHRLTVAPPGLHPHLIVSMQDRVAYQVLDHPCEQDGVAGGPGCGEVRVDLIAGGGRLRGSGVDRDVGNIGQVGVTSGGDALLGTCQGE